MENSSTESQTIYLFNYAEVRKIYRKKSHLSYKENAQCLDVALARGKEEKKPVRTI